MEEESLNNSVPDSTIIKLLIAENKKLRFTIGVNQAYIDELECTLKKEQNENKELKKLDKEIRKDVKKEALYTNIKKLNKTYRERIKELIQIRNILFSELSKYKQQDKY